MFTIISNAGGLFAIILTGFILKRLKLVKKSDGKVISTIIVTVTLPATVLVGLNTMTVSFDFLLLAGSSILINIGLVLIAKKLWRNRLPLEKNFFMYTISGYNIGNFTLPLIQSFYPLALPYLFMFDVGNCIMIAGGTKIMVQSTQADFDKNQSGQLLRQTLLRSLPFLSYLLMVVLKSFHLSFPQPAITIFQLFANANAFLSMLMIGIYLELFLPKNELKLVSSILGWRYFLAGLLALCINFILPISNSLLKNVLMLVCFAPISTFAVINSVEAGVKEELTGFISSISIILSLVIMTILMLYLT